MTSSDILRFHSTSHPVLYEVNTRVFLNELSARAGTKLTLDKIPDAILDEWAELGIDLIWLMGVWTVGVLPVRIAREHAGLQNEYRKALPDYTDDDIIGSPYAVSSYTVSRSLGGKKALLALRRKLAKRGIGLVLDFVSNHTARDHKWVKSNPEYYVAGEAGEEKQRPDYYFKTSTVKGEMTLAFGRDPYFPGWTDSAQLNPRHPGARKAMIKTLLSIADLCDGVRCDMAMLILNQVFQNTWGDRALPRNAAPEESEFWADAISAVRAARQKFLFIAEAYWDLEWPLQELGFDYTYDKKLYDRLLREGAGSVYDHLKAEMAYQKRSVRFVENHDEPRIARVLRSDVWQYAAATIAATVPGMVLLHEGQLEGRQVKIPVQLGRRPDEPVVSTTKAFYHNLLQCLKADVFRRGEWKLLATRPAWHDNSSYRNFLSYLWKGSSGFRLVVVNYAPHNSQCYLPLDLEEIQGHSIEFKDLMSPATYVRDKITLNTRGMYFDMPGYGVHIFELKPHGRA